MIDSESVEISVVVPVYNEEENLPIFMTKLVEVLKGLHKTHEVIFVDVGVQTEAERCSKRWPSTIRLFGSLNFSLTGGLIVLSYAIYRKDPVFIVAYGARNFIYLRNLYFIYKRKPTLVVAL